MKTITITIKKPLYGTYVYLNGNIVDRAIRTSSMLEIEIPRGKAIVDPVKWKANGKVMKKVFKFPDNPMILYGGNVPLSNDKGKIVNSQIENNRQQKLI